MFKFKEYDLKKYSIGLLALIFILGILSVYTLYLLSSRYPSLYKRQIFGFIAGFAIAVFVSMFDYHFVCKFFIPLYIINILLLVYTLKAGFSYSSQDTTRRWISLFGLTDFQPSELTKIIMILFMSKYFDLLKKNINKWYTIIGSVVLMAIPAYLVIEQPDLSTTILLLACFAVLVLVSGVTYKVILPVIGVSIPALCWVVWFSIKHPGVLLREYHVERILSFIHPEDYRLDTTWQQYESVSAISSGGLLGKLLSGSDSVRQAVTVPVVSTDFIFTAICEEFGFLGALAVIIIITLIVFKIFQIGREAKDDLGKMIAVGIATLFMVQSFINIGVASFLLPNTGVVLPFLSYGLSSLMVNFISIGIALNISVQKKKVREEVLSL